MLLPNSFRLVKLHFIVTVKSHSRLNVGSCYRVRDSLELAKFAFSTRNITFEYIKQCKQNSFGPGKGLRLKRIVSLRAGMLQPCLRKLCPLSGVLFLVISRCSDLTE